MSARRNSPLFSGDAGGGGLDQARVLVLLHAAGGRGKTSGVVLGQHGGGGAGLIHVDGGKVTRLVAYFDRDRALADLGLTPDTGT